MFSLLSTMGFIIVLHYPTNMEWNYLWSNKILKVVGFYQEDFWAHIWHYGGYFYLLRHALSLQYIARYDQMRLTYLALHNILLDVNRLHKNWEQCNLFEWNLINKDDNNQTPVAIARLKIQCLNHKFQILIHVQHALEVCFHYARNKRRIIVEYSIK